LSVVKRLNKEGELIAPLYFYIFLTFMINNSVVWYFLIP